MYTSLMYTSRDVCVCACVCVVCVLWVCCVFFVVCVCVCVVCKCARVCTCAWGEVNGLHNIKQTHIYTHIHTQHVSCSQFAHTHTCTRCDE